MGNVLDNNLPIVPSRDSAGYKNLQEKARKLKEDIEIEKCGYDFVIVESEDV